MREFTQEMLDKLYEANKQVKGTPIYNKYHMETEFKSKNRWKFIGHGIPHHPGEFKIVRGKTYIVADSFGEQERYAVTQEVFELLNL